MKGPKRIYGEQSERLQNEDLLSCLNLFFKFGYVSKAKLTLIREFVASKSINEEEIKKTIDHFTVSCLVAWPLNESEAGVDLVLIETSLLFSC